ncbi:MAG TPA: hypothetical protein VLA04_00305 [Verrucomicrobiae bacterium]|nr:hypothetical protein [Verrucomicrobiae bacterium]
MTVSRGLTPALILATVSHVASLFIPLEWPSVLNFLSHLLSLIGMAWALSWLLTARKEQKQIKVGSELILALAFLSWVVSAYYIGTAKPEPALGISPAGMVSNILHLIFLGALTWVTVYTHLYTETKPQSS